MNLFEVVTFYKCSGRAGELVDVREIRQLSECENESDGTGPIQKVFSKCAFADHSLLRFVQRGAR